MSSAREYEGRLRFSRKLSDGPPLNGNLAPLLKTPESNDRVNITPIEFSLPAVNISTFYFMLQFCLKADPDLTQDIAYIYELLHCNHFIIYAVPLL